MSLYGRSATIPESVVSIPKNHLDGLQFDNEFKNYVNETIRTLHLIKEEAIQKENFVQAQQAKIQLEALIDACLQLNELMTEKLNAIKSERYDSATSHKKHIETLKQTILTTDYKGKALIDNHSKKSATWKPTQKGARMEPVSANDVLIGLVSSSQVTSSDHLGGRSSHESSINLHNVNRSLSPTKRSKSSTEILAAETEILEEQESFDKPELASEARKSQKAIKNSNVKRLVSRQSILMEKLAILPQYLLTNILMEQEDVKLEAIHDLQDWMESQMHEGSFNTEKWSALLEVYVFSLQDSRPMILEEGLLKFFNILHSPKYTEQQENTNVRHLLMKAVKYIKQKFESPKPIHHKIATYGLKDLQDYCLGFLDIFFKTVYMTEEEIPGNYKQRILQFMRDLKWHILRTNFLDTYKELQAQIIKDSHNSHAGIRLQAKILLRDASELNNKFDSHMKKAVDIKKGEKLDQTEMLLDSVTSQSKPSSDVHATEDVSAPNSDPSAQD